MEERTRSHEATAVEVAHRLRAAASVVVLTGAGMSAESGIPTFRGGDNSLWCDFDPETLATPSAFRRDPALVWGWYRWRSSLVAQAQPHEGHRALAWLEGRVPELHIVTQNVDDLHERAGSRQVVHLHGSLFAPRCFACAQPHRLNGQPDGESAPAGPELRIEPPRCEHCGGRIRPGVVWFGEALPQAQWQQAVRTVRAAGVALVIGTSGLVQPAASLALEARRAGAFVVEINPAGTGQSRIVDRVWRSTAAEALAALVDVVSSA